MEKLFLSCTLAIGCLISTQTYAKNSNDTSLYVNAVASLQQSMPRKATIDGKRICRVVSNHSCFITVTMESSRKHKFSLLNWPESRIDDAGYTEFILKDTDDKPHILRTDGIKGKKFLASMKSLIKNCQDFTKQNKTSES